MVMENEQRTYEHVLEVRDDTGESNTRTLVGRIPYNSPTLIQTRWDEFLEELSADAFKNTLASDEVIRGLWNHDRAKPIGSTKPGTLRLNSTADYLEYEIDLPNNTWGNDLYESVKRGDVDGTSFGFAVREDKWSKVNHEGREILKRTIMDAQLVEVSPCTFPAYDTSSVSCRSLEELRENEKMDAIKLAYAKLILEED